MEQNPIKICWDQDLGMANSNTDWDPSQLLVVVINQCGWATSQDMANEDVLIAPEYANEKHIGSADPNTVQIAKVSVIKVQHWEILS